MALAIWIVAGYALGTLIALTLDRLYTGASLRAPVPAARDPLRVPLLWLGTPGYLLMHGRFRGGDPVPARLWYLPLLGAGAGALIALRAQSAGHAALATLFSAVLVAFVGTDFERRLLPNRVMYPALALALALSWAWPDRNALASLAGGAAAFAIMFVVFLFVPGFGFGDVKLAGLLGLIVGIANMPSALFVGAIAGGVASIGMLATRRGGLRTAMAYGPYLALGALVGMLPPQ